MTKQIEIGRLSYELEKVNPETGWVMVKNQNATSFWLPEELVAEINHIHNGVSKVQDHNERLFTKNNELRLKIDSQRKSITYYKGERDALNHTLSQHSKEADIVRKKSAANLANIEKKVDNLEFLLIDKTEELEIFKRQASFRLTMVSVALGIGLVISIIW